MTKDVNTKQNTSTVELRELPLELTVCYRAVCVVKSLKHDSHTFSSHTTNTKYAEWNSVGCKTKRSKLRELPPELTDRYRAVRVVKSLKHDCLTVSHKTNTNNWEWNNVVYNVNTPDVTRDEVCWGSVTSLEVLRTFAL